MAQKSPDEIKEQRKQQLASGWLSTIVGIAFLVTFVILRASSWDPSTLSPEVLLQVWTMVAAVILLVWGINRILQKTEKDNKPKWIPDKLKNRLPGTPGQPTINFVVTIVGATFAIIAILLTVPPSKG
jgi:hypothetical protein